MISPGRATQLVRRTLQAHNVHAVLAAAPRAPRVSVTPRPVSQVVTVETRAASPGRADTTLISGPGPFPLPNDAVAALAAAVAPHGGRLARGAFTQGIDVEWS